MKIYLFNITVILLYSISVNSQNSSSTTIHPKTNLFENGLPVNDCETNLKNFFNNFSKYAKDDNITLISYKYVGEIKSKKQIRRYMKINLDPELWNLHISYKTGGTEESEPLEILFYETPDNQKGKMIKENIEKTKVAINEMSDKYVKIGFKVYNIKFSYKNKERDYYIFINPNNKKVVIENNFWGFDFKSE